MSDGLFPYWQRYLYAFWCFPKGTYAAIHTSGETTVQSTQQATYEDVDASRTEKQHAYVNVCTKQLTYDAVLVDKTTYLKIAGGFLNRAKKFHASYLPQIITS